jgi:hypothetical protein
LPRRAETFAMPNRFVILEHDWNGIHYDVMLQEAGFLRTWRLAALPSTEPQPAIPLGDHRLIYLDYEGPVSGGRGIVRRVASGEFEAIESAADRVLASLAGSLCGRLELRRDANGRWTAQLLAEDAI